MFSSYFQQKLCLEQHLAKLQKSKIQDDDHGSDDCYYANYLFGQALLVFNLHAKGNSQPIQESCWGGECPQTLTLYVWPKGLTV